VTYAENRLRMNKYYQPQPRRTRRENPKETRVNLSHFYGKENVETYLEWEMRVEKLFACHHVSEERKVPLATISFQGNAMYWWIALKKERHLHKNPPITYWNDLRGALRCHYIPSYYNRKLMDKLQRLHKKKSKCRRIFDGRGPSTNPIKAHQNATFKTITRVIVKEGSMGHFYMS